MVITVILVLLTSRYMYGETLGRWRSADLLIGLAYMARRELDYRPIADIAEQGTPFGWGLEGQNRTAAKVCAAMPLMASCIPSKACRLASCCCCIPRAAHHRRVRTRGLAPQQFRTRCYSGGAGPPYAMYELRACFAQPDPNSAAGGFRV